ncbi:MAG: hypothetical protein JXL97_15485 [Bacteroidales bacterium]|nr:hypothetical protein [Bacteroidales bacterium]
MRKIILSVIVFNFLFLLALTSNSQSFTLVKSVDFKNVNKLFDTVDNFKPKVVFVEDSPILLYNKGLPASDVILKAGDVANLVGFSQNDYEFIYKQETYMLPYLKIRFDGASYWVHGMFPFVFDDAHPDASFVANDVKYNVYTAKCLKFLGEEFYEGYEIIVVKNTAASTYKLISCNDFPVALSGHSYGSAYAYLQNDMGVVEQITKAEVENLSATLDVEANYQEGGATYKISFNVEEIQPEAQYWRVIMQK